MRHATWVLLLSFVVAACGRTTDDERGQEAAPGAGGRASGIADESVVDSNAGKGGLHDPPRDGHGGAAAPVAGSSAAGAFATGSAGEGGGGSGAAPAAGANSGDGGAAPVSPYAARSGKFKMVVLSRTRGYRHSPSIQAGTVLLTQIAAELGIDPPLVTEDTAFLDALDDYELVFFMNTSGDIFTSTEEAKFETWMKRGGAFCGTHSATDTEFGWGFYLDVIGQNYEGHGYADTPDSNVFDERALAHPALRDLPNPWERREEWMAFKSADQWATKDGFAILARKQSDQLPIAWVREHDNFRSFYTAIGHAGEVFEDPNVKRHLTGGIMWAVRREHCLVAPKPAGCP